MTNDAAQKVTETTEAIKAKAKGSVTGVLGIAQVIKDKVSGD